MKQLSIFMDRDQSLRADSYILGVEGDHRIEGIFLTVPRYWGDTDISECEVGIHLKAEDEYYYNGRYEVKEADDKHAAFFFVVTREMTCKSGRAFVEFSFNNDSVPFHFTSRVLELMIASPLADSDSIESDYPGQLADVLNAVEDLTERVDDAEKSIDLLSEGLDGAEKNIDLLTEGLDEVSDLQESVADIEAFLGYKSEDIIGLQVDFENKTFTRLAGAKGLSAGEDFNRFSVYRDRVRCNVADDGTITALYDDSTEDWTEICGGSAVFSKMGDTDDAGGVDSSGFPHNEPAHIPHISCLGDNIRITVTNHSAGDSVTQFNSTLGTSGNPQNFGEFQSSDGRTITLSGFPNGEGSADNTQVSYDGRFVLFIHPYCSDSLDIRIDLATNEGDSAYSDDGSNGQVMVYQPKFYYRVVPIKLQKQENGSGYHIRKANYYISATPKRGFRLHPAFYDESGKPVDYILMSAYEGSMWDASAGAYVNDNVDKSISYAVGDLLCSVGGKKPISGLRSGIGTKANLELMAKNRGKGWHLETVKSVSANQLLMMIELGTLNTQTGIGDGVVYIKGNAAENCSSLTGSTAGLGSGTGSAAETVNEIGGTETAYTVAGEVSVSYRGVENPWGNIFKHIQGINIWGNGTMGGGQPYVAGDFNFNESKRDGNYKPVGFTLANDSGWVSAMGYGGEDFDWLLMPSEVGGTSALPVGDAFVSSQDLNGYRIVLLGGSWTFNVSAGGFYWYCYFGVNERVRTIGGRLIYVPTAK